MRTETLTVRAIKRGESLDVQWLASPARAPLSTSPGLLAERDGLPVAAIALTSGAVLVDPRRPEPEAVRLLKLVRYQVMRQGSHSGVWRSLLRGAGSHTATTCDTRSGSHRVEREMSGSMSGVAPLPTQSPR